MKFRVPVYGRITMVISGIAILTMSGFMALAVWSSDRYHQEATQRRHWGLAQYILEHLPAPLFSSQGEVDQSVLETIAHNTMMINPSVEVYLLNTDGEVLGHALPDLEVVPVGVDMAPVMEFMSSSAVLPVFGQNPRDQATKSIFSVAPVEIGERLQGYLYVVLASQNKSSPLVRMADRHTLRVALAATSALVLLVSLSIFFSFRMITRPLRQVTRQVRQYRLSHLGEGAKSDYTGDEMEELEHSFALMSRRIQQQFDQLNQADQLRRELVSNVSHDLRTPLASMQGYLETLMLKMDQLTPARQKQYLQVAYRHTCNMNRLVSQLFELSKLEAGRIEPRMEAFSLTELLFDIRQEYELTAQRKNVSLELDVVRQDLQVIADIELIQRVLQNLLDNALRHTPQGGCINIRVEPLEGSVQVSLKDSGSGIQARDLPYVFERHYQSDAGRYQGERGGAGLGLSIVRRILEMHGASIQVKSAESRGTCFSFLLPAPSG
ncbi:hypothetical protein BTA51_26955 [Hahella sp. CCB-MM4]|uniref:sensor histidine kinase n=1 Tax=Hahella sp. (strain CCB-MM4) TaxID=1926491 RepID=UPI000BC92439|nr:ATP-binding protein [Hahella sp. CCB-MM4]OZG70243.1 hypothetical protein BTA51_26955 [Hahella sp. CCB-MM4]